MFGVKVTPNGTVSTAIQFPSYRLLVLHFTVC